MSWRQRVGCGEAQGQAGEERCVKSEDISMTAFEEGAVFSSRNHLYYQSQECPARRQC